MPSYITEILGSGTAQYWADQSGNPVMMKSDTPWALAYNAGNSGGATTYQSDIDAYCATRASQGFNCFLAAAVGTPQIGAPTNGNSWDGVAPFTAPGVLNDPFWTRVDYMISSAAAQGLTVILNPMFTYAIGNAGAAMSTWTAANFTTYGTALGARYGAAANLLWEFGDDYGDGDNTFFSNCLAAIRATGDTHLISVENLSPGTSRFALNNSVFSWGTANAQFNWCYGYGCAYNAVEYAYQEASPLLVMKMDGIYDNGANGDPRIFWRKWALWSLSSGSRGFQYGSTPVYPWPPGALASLTNNNPDNVDFKIFWNIFAALAGWHQLVPDTASALVTAGRGTRWLDSNDAPANVGANTYVTASKTADGRLAVIYIPDATTTVTVNGGLLATGYGAKWIDPTNGAATAATIASTYSHPAANALGDHDWLLVLATPPYATWTVP